MKFTKSILLMLLIPNCIYSATIINFDTDTKWRNTSSTQIISETVVVDGKNVFFTIISSPGNLINTNTTGGFGVVGGLDGVGDVAEYITLTAVPQGPDFNVSFDALSARPDGANAVGSVTTLEILDGDDSGNQVATVDVTSGSTSANASLFNIGGGSLTFKFVGTTDNDGLAAGFLESVTMSTNSIPEPSSTAFIALSGLMLFLRKRKLQH